MSELRLCPICNQAWFGLNCTHKYGDVFEYAIILRKQLDVANKQLRYTEELLDDWFDESGEYLSPTAIRDQITYIKSEIEKIGGVNVQG